MSDQPQELDLGIPPATPTAAHKAEVNGLALMAIASLCDRDLDMVLDILENAENKLSDPYAVRYCIQLQIAVHRERRNRRSGG